jgi:hypothetical protein
MNQDYETQASIEAEALEAQQLPELQAAFDIIEKFTGNDEELIIDDDGLPGQREEEVEEKEEEPEDSSEDAIEEEEPEEEEFILKKPVKEKKTDKYRKLQNDKYRALAEKEEALQRLAEMEELMAESLHSGTYHYSKNVYAELDRAKESKRKAFEEGDMDNLLEADIEIMKAVQAINDLEKWANENEPRVPARSNYQNYQDDQRLSYQQDTLHQEIAKDWVDSHPYLKPTSRSYNPDLADDVTQFIEKLDNNLYRNRQEEAIFSEEYFDTIDNYIQSRNISKRDNSKNIESLSNVSGVRNSSSSGGSKSSSINKFILTQDEKMMAERAGVSPKEWLKNKIYYSKKQTGEHYGR